MNNRFDKDRQFFWSPYQIVGLIFLLTVVVHLTGNALLFLISKLVALPNLSPIILMNLMLPIIEVILLLLTIGLWTLPKASITREFNHIIRNGLFLNRYGNPLKLRDGDLLPRIKTTEKRFNAANGPIFRYYVSISVTSVSAKKLEDISQIISSLFVGRLQNLAVTQVYTLENQTKVIYEIESVTYNKKLQLDLAAVTKQNKDPFMIPIQVGTNLDLRTSGSIILTGKTRSGKTTALTYLVLKIATIKPDKFGSRIVIIDPKQAELSRIKGVVSPEFVNDSLDVHNILKTVEDFEKQIAKRQDYLNSLGTSEPGAAHWWEANMSPSILVIDEFVALRSMFPDRATVKNGDYNYRHFEDVLRRIVTMGASAGCYVILSIAQANATILPTLLRDAFTTKVLFKPTLEEARFLWDSENLQNVQNLAHADAGDSWFSSTDGINDSVSLVRWPQLKFGEYKALSDALEDYNQKRAPSPQE